MEQKLRLPEFKVLHQKLRRGIPWLDHLILGFLFYLEEHLINARIKNEVTKAVEEYEKIDSPIVSLPEPVYSEKPSDTSTRLPEMRLTAPWHKESID